MPHSLQEGEVNGYNHHSLFFDSLNLGDCGFDRLAGRFGKIGIDFARFLYIIEDAVVK